jgi:transcriptional regulator with XRE-family HTH domain
MSKNHFDAERFYQAIDNERKNRDLTWMKVAEKCEISPSTLTRMGQGKRPDVDTLAALAKWSGLDVGDYYVGETQISKTPAVLTGIPALLRADKSLDKPSAEIIEAVLVAAYEKMRKKNDAET